MHIYYIYITTHSSYLCLWNKRVYCDYEKNDEWCSSLNPVRWKQKMGII